MSKRANHFFQRKTTRGKYNDVIDNIVPKFINDNEWIKIDDADVINMCLPSMASRKILSELKNFDVWVRKSHYKLSGGIYAKFISSLYSIVDEYKIIAAMSAINVVRNDILKQSWYTIKSAIEDMFKFKINENWDEGTVSIDKDVKKDKKG